MYQLQQQIQRLRDDLNNISQLCSQLQQQEQMNSSHLQQLHQRELHAAQQLQRINSMANRIYQDINQVSSMAQQLSGQMTTGMYQSGGPAQYAQSGWSNQPGTFSGQIGYSPTGWTGQFGPSGQYGMAQPATGYGQAYSYTGIPGGQFSAQYNANPVSNQGAGYGQYGYQVQPGFSGAQSFAGAGNLWGSGQMGSQPGQYGSTQYGAGMISGGQWGYSGLQSSASSQMGYTSGMTGQFGDYQTAGNRNFYSTNYLG